MEDQEQKPAEAESIVVPVDPAPAGITSEDKGWLDEIKAAWNSWTKSGKSAAKSENKVAQSEDKVKDAPVSRAEHDAMQKQLQAIEAQLKDKQESDKQRATAELEGVAQALINTAKESGAIGGDDTEAEKWIKKLAGADLKLAKETVERLSKSKKAEKKEINFGEDIKDRIKQISRSNAIR